MIKVSIICMIYKSTKFADWIYKSVQEFTPMLSSGEAEFFFIANDPTQAVVEHLRKKQYPFAIALHKKQTAQELEKKGFERREYLSRVYTAWNQAILHAKGQMVCLINSDNYFSPDWLENLLKYANYNTMVTPQLVEPTHHLPVFWCARNGEFGNHPDSFDKKGFLKYADKIRQTGIKMLGVFQPCLLYKDIAIYAGMYPQGNKINPDGTVITGDTFFSGELYKLGIRHITALDSIVYHLGEGEMKDPDSDETVLCDADMAGRDLLPQYSPPVHYQLCNIKGELPQNESAEKFAISLRVEEDSNKKEVKAMIMKGKNQIYGGRERPLYLYCAGANGKKLKRELIMRDIPITAFSDSNEKLWGQEIEGIICLRPEELDKKGIIIVTKDNPEVLSEQLRQRGYTRVLDYSSVNAILNGTPVIKKE